VTLTSTRDTQEQTPVTSGGLFRYVDAVLRPVNATVERYFLQVASWPALVVMLAVTAIPFVITIGLAFTNYDLVRYDQWRFIGLDNFEELANDRQTPIILVNTVVLVVFTTLIPTVFGLGLAVLMERSIRGMGLIRTLFLVPIMTAPVVVALTWRAMFNNDAGWINYFLGLVGLPTPVWLGDPLLAMPVVIIADAWTSIPFQAILLLAALLTVPSELKEAAGVDGAGRTRTFWHITLPWIRPVLFVVIVLRFMDAFRKFEGIQQLTRGGPGLASTPINLQIYNTGLFYSRVGYAAAWGLVMVAMIAASLVIVYLVRRRLA
jgi:multiple sugar transport system permease protein